MITREDLAARAENAGGETGASRPDGGGPALTIPRSAQIAAAAAEEKAGRDTVLLAMGELLGVVDAFVVTSGGSRRHVLALAEEIERRLKDERLGAPSAVEGLRDGTWVLMDYGDTVVHVFDDETRRYYDLEHLWSSAPRLTWPPPR
ncbi:MAG: ribosome silencing factor [Actinomycetota bacterium]|nr:ribosome silencing factor [Actinomycetota bacterium]